LVDVADTASCGSYAVVRHARDGDHRHLCSAREVAHSLWMEVCVNYNCATTSARAAGGVMPDVVRIGRAMGSSGVASRHDLDNFAPARLLPRVVPWRGIAPGQPSATQRDTRLMDGSTRHRRLPLQREQGDRSFCRAKRRENAGGLCTEEPTGCVSLPSAGSHCLNGLPEHRSIAVAGRRGQANGGEPAVRIGNKTEWPAFMAASRSRRGGRHLMPSRVLIKGHTGTLRARAGCCPEVATPACRVPRGSILQAGSASSSMPPSG
jgi:hypothetical protein